MNIIKIKYLKKMVLKHQLRNHKSRLILNRFILINL